MMRQNKPKDGNPVRPSIPKEEVLIELATEIQEIGATLPAARVMPERRITRPNSTNEHLITEFDLARFENSGDGQMHSWALLFIGGAISSVVPFIGSLIQWWTKAGVVSALDIGQLILFPLCLVAGGLFFKVAPTPNKKLKEYCDEIRSREAVKPGDI